MLAALQRVWRGETWPQKWWRGETWRRRKACALCGGEAFQEVYRLGAYPASMSATAAAEAEDYAPPFTVVECVACECVQLVELIDPAFLYKDAHNNTAATPTWKEHHRRFAEFILERSGGGGSTEILEIGGADGALARHLLAAGGNRLQLTSLDLCSKHADISGVRFVSGNCETWKFPEGSTVVMSHVFEHLYRPAEFVRHLGGCGVKSVFVSVPDMNGWLKRGVLSFLHREHTFYCDSDYLIRLFQRNGYGYVGLEQFGQHSVFMQFELGGECRGLERAEDSDISRCLGARFREYYRQREKRLEAIDISGPTYIFPAGHYGQLAYVALKERGMRAEIIGFLDNDPDKIGKRMYGTPLHVQSPEVLRGAGGCTILLVGSVYVAEIREQLLEVCPSARIIEV